MSELKTYMRTIDKKIGQRIYQARIASGFKLKDLARSIDVSGQQLHKYEKAQNRVPISRLFVIAKTLDEDINYFLEDSMELDNSIAISNNNERFFGTKKGLIKKISKIKDIHIIESLSVLVGDLLD